MPTLPDFDQTARGDDDWILAFEDLNGKGGDYQDMVVMVSDITPDPEPMSIALFGVGRVGLAGATRKRMNRHNV